MAKTLEQVLQEQIGGMVFQIAKLTADLEIAREYIKELEAEKAKQASQP